MLVRERLTDQLESTGEVNAGGQEPTTNINIWHHEELPLWGDAMKLRTGMDLKWPARG
jgi:hypothetical protein